MEPFVVGFDLGETYSQICCWRLGKGEPVSLSVVPGAEKYRIPTESLDVFLKKSLKLLKGYGKIHEAAAVVFSVNELDEELVSKIKTSAMQVAGIPESRIYVQTKEESFCTYVLHQPRELWRYQAVLFEYEGESLRARILSTNARRKPALARIDGEQNFWAPLSGLTAEEKDEAFLQLIRQVFTERPVSVVYLVGEGFEEQWYRESLKLLCSGRRVFVGNNLYAKGACYRAAQEAKKQTEYVFLGADKISYHVGLKTKEKGKEGVYTLLNAGMSWYEAKAECEVLLCEEPVLEFVLRPMQGDVILKESLLLEGIPNRPPKTGRLKIKVEFMDPDRFRIEVWDLGFGELFPSSELHWTEEIDLGQER